MLILLIRTDKPKAELYLYEDRVELAKQIWQADRHLAETIHIKLKQMFDQAAKTMGALEGIGVYRGPGSFTGLRIGHSVANSLAYSLKLPITSAEGRQWQKEAITKLRLGENEHIALPKYGAPARTTSPKK